MIFVDTSVWVTYFRGRDARITRALKDLLDEDRVALAIPTWIELLSRASKSDLPVLKRVLSALPRFYAQNDTWEKIEQWIEKASIQGHRFSAIDLLIGAIASDQNAEIWSLDHDFVRMSQLKFFLIYTI